MLVCDPAGAAGDSRPRAAKSKQPPTAAVVVSYADLIDGEAVTRTGRRVAAAARDPRTPRAHLQPFLDGYTSLLPYVVEMARGADPVPRRDILERWPAGSPQPAWAALFRGGRYRAVADGKGRVALFLPGDDPAAAWRRHYSVVRHCLNALAAAGKPLSVEVFAYRNDYRRQELSLDLRPVRVAGSSFPPDRTRLDIRSLEDFFSAGARLEGAQLDPAEGLILYGDPGNRDSLPGGPIALADLAVAYRSAFHAGDNDAFVSLDPHADPTLAAVNFGGHLEDTRMGAAVLAADRIFKTIASGLDPVTFRDRRAEIRKSVPSFLTSSERAFLDRATPPAAGWMKVRCWFYPDSVGVDTDPAEGLAVITRPQFTAASERMAIKPDGGAGGAKRTVLPPAVAESIHSINADYARYTDAFPEFADLAPVARLMAIAAWLRRSDTAWLDLDDLLSVELPAVSTPRTLEQVVSTEYVFVPASEKITAANVTHRSGVIWLNPALRRTVGEVFGDAKTLADYLCARRGPGEAACVRSEGEDAKLFEERREKPLRSLLGSERDKLPLLDFVSSRIQYPLPEQATDLERRLGGTQAAGFWRTRSTVQMHGGIELRAADFAVRASADSPALLRFKQRVRGAALAKGVTTGASLIRSRPASTSPREKPDVVRAPAAGSKARPRAAAPTRAVVAPEPAKAPVAAGAPKLVSRSVSLPAGVAGAGGVRGEVGRDGRIVFRKASP